MKKLDFYQIMGYTFSIMKKNTFNIYWSNMKGVRAAFIISLVLRSILPLGSIFQSDITKNIVDEGLVAKNFDLLPVLVLALIAIQLIRSVFNYILRIVLHNTSQTVLLNVRKNLYSNMQRQDMDFFKKYPTGELMSRMSSDLDWIRYSISFFLPNILDALVTFISTLIYLLFINVPLTLCLLVCTPPLFILTRGMSTKVRPFYQKMRAKMADLNKVVQENIAGNRVVKAFATEGFEVEKFDKENEELRSIQINATNRFILFKTPMDFIATFMAAVALVGGGYMAIKGNISIGELSIIISLSWSLSVPLRTLGRLMNDSQKIQTATERIQPIYYAEPSIVNPENPVTPEKNDGEIVFDHVTLELDGRKILDDVSFKIGKGQTLAIMGPTGSGKTFLTNLILRLYDVTEGRILIDGVDVRDYDIKELRRKIAVSTQDVFLFSETIEGNICYGVPDIPVEEVVEAAKTVQAYDFIVHTTDGFDTIIGERGVGLSGGQKQRLALARAIAVKAPILILDDTTSALDMETEHEIRERLKEYCSKATQLIVAQRISSVSFADRIIVLKDGKISEDGTHDELIKHDGYYKEIYELQYND